MRFGTPGERREVTRALTKVFATKTREEWAKLLMDRDTCVTPVLTVEEALTSDWAKDLHMLVDLGEGESVVNGPLRSAPAMRGRRFTRAPSLGEHTDRLMRKLGYTKKEVTGLRSAGAIQ